MWGTPGHGNGKTAPRKGSVDHNRVAEADDTLRQDLGL
jgi:hypothetical protein